MTINRYAECGLDRLDILRDDPDWLNRVLEKDQTRVLFLRQGEHRIDDAGNPWIGGPKDLRSHIDQADLVALLGCDCQGRHWVVADLTQTLDSPWRSAQLRDISRDLSHDLASRLAYARALVHWHTSHRHCGYCGALTQSRRAGHQRDCPSCGHSHYPRLDPAVIMLVHHDDQVLLGRQAHWPAGRHSVLAGYVEHGESLEEAVRREVMEEAGIQVDQVRYHSSQPWPFPSSLMLGFTARALTQEIRIDGRELESAAWYSRAQLKDLPQGLRLPSADSIARVLLEQWINGDLPR